MAKRLDGARDGAEAGHGRSAVVAGAHVAVGQRRLAAQGRGNPGALESAVVEDAVVMQRVMRGNRDEGRRQTGKVLEGPRKASR
jgi:hypothetical protein